MGINIGIDSDGHFIGGGEVVQNDNLVLHLDPYDYGSMGENGGTPPNYIRDLSAYENDFTMINGADSKSEGHWSFDGTDDFAYIIDDSDFDIGTNDFTIQMWIKLTTTDTAYIFNKWSPFSGYLMVFYSGSMRCRMNDVYVNLDSVKTWTGNWVNVAWTCDRDGSTKLYHNGVLANTDYGTIVTSAINTSYYTYISCYSDTSTTATTDEITGYVGPVLFYNGIALTANQINQNFNVYRGIYGI